MRLIRILVLVASLITALLLPTMSAFADDGSVTTDQAPPTDMLPEIPDDPGWGV